MNWFNKIRINVFCLYSKFIFQLFNRNFIFYFLVFYEMKYFFTFKISIVFKICHIFILNV